MYRLCSKLMCLYVKASVFAQARKMLAYDEIGQYPVNHRFVMFYSTGPYVKPHGWKLHQKYFIRLYPSVRRNCPRLRVFWIFLIFYFFCNGIHKNYQQKVHDKFFDKGALPSKSLLCLLWGMSDPSWPIPV